MSQPVTPNLLPAEDLGRRIQLGGINRFLRFSFFVFIYNSWFSACPTRRTPEAALECQSALGVNPLIDRTK